MFIKLYESYENNTPPPPSTVFAGFFCKVFQMYFVSLLKNA